MWLTVVIIIVGAVLPAIAVGFLIQTETFDKSQQ